MDKIIISGITMPRTKTLVVGGKDENKEITMASGKIVQEVIGFRKTITANWEWLPDGVLARIVPVARAGNFVQIQYPDPVQGDTSGMFKISIGDQKVFRFRNNQPYWYNVELTATAQEVE